MSCVLIKSTAQKMRSAITVCIEYLQYITIPYNNIYVPIAQCVTRYTEPIQGYNTIQYSITIQHTIID